MPLGIIVWDNWRDQSGSEGVADGVDGLAKGREMVVVEHLRFIKMANFKNTVWFSASVP